MGTTRVLCLFVVILVASEGRTVVKRSPQLSLTVIEDDPTTPRMHPPSPEDLEERRQALVKAIAGEGGGDGSALAAQLMTLTELGQDLIGGSVGSAGELFAPLRNATQKARENFPRVGDVINRVVDAARAYRKQTSGVLRETGSNIVQNGVRLLTTAGSRGTQVLSDAFKVFRSLFDNFTLVIQNLAQTLSRGITRFIQVKSSFLANGVQKVRRVISNRRLLQPAKDAAQLSGNLVRGLGEDFAQAQPWLNEGVKSKIALASALVPRVNLADILAPSNDEKPCGGGEELDVTNNDNNDGESKGGYEKKRSMESSSESSEEKGKTTEGIPSDILELLGSANSNSETKTKLDETTTTTEDPGSNEVSDSSTSKSSSTTTETAKTTTEKPSSSPKRKTSMTSTTTAKPTTEKASSNSKRRAPTTTTTTTTATTTTSKSKESSTNKTLSSIEDLFGLDKDEKKSS